MKIIIIGGGASGLMLANLLIDAKCNCEVTLLEKLDHVGKKILISGNGRCNLSNKNMNEGCYNNDFALKVSKSFDVVSYFKQKGLLCVCDSEGRYYPLSLVSNNVLDVLRHELNKINVINNFNVIRVIKKDNSYEVCSDNNKKLSADIVVMAMGGKTFYKECNCHSLAAMLSHRITPLKPTLIGLKVDESLSSIVNLKVRVLATLYNKNEIIYQDSGEVLFKNDGLSGIVMFQCSSIMARYSFGNFKISLDLLPSMSIDEVAQYINDHPSLVGLFPRPLNQFLIKRAKSTNKEVLAQVIKNLTFNVFDIYDFKNAQVTSGGVNLDDLKETFESKANNNCYIMGEMVDVDGICGGYNLHFAFASASKVAADIIGKVKKENE